MWRPPNTAFSCEGPPRASTRGAAKRLHAWNRPRDLVSCNALFCGPGEDVGTASVSIGVTPVVAAVQTAKQVPGEPPFVSEGMPQLWHRQPHPVREQF